MLAGGKTIFVPEIADYEVRRELLRAGRVRGIERLDQLGQRFDYLPITTAVMRQAAAFWAEARRQGRPTAPDPALDADMILAAQAALIVAAGDQAVIATTTVQHLSLFADARRWQDIG